MFSIFFFLSIFIGSIVFGTLINPIGFSGIIINIFLLIFFKQRINKKTLIICFILLSIVLLRIGFYIVFDTSNEVTNKNSTYYVSENYKSTYIVINQQKQKISLNKNYFLKNDIKNLFLEINDKFTGCIKTEKIKNNNSGFYWFLKSKNINHKGFISMKNCELKINKSNNLYNKILNYFNSTKNTKFKDWVKFLLFQKKTENLDQLEINIRNLNISHIFVISGFHMFIICWIWISISKKVKKQFIKNLIKIIAILFCLFFTYLTNWKLSTLKALIVFIWILFFKKKYIKIKMNNFLSLLFIIFLIYNPLFISRIDFQLSFLASWGYTTFYKKKEENQKKIFYYLNLLKTNFIILILLLPIIININFKLSIFSVINSILFSSIIFILYPLFLITVWILPLQYFWSFIFRFLEKIITLFNLWNIELSIGEIKWCLILSYYLFLLILIKLKLKNIKNVFLLILLIFSLSFLSINKSLNNKNIYKLTMFNVNHGLSMLLSNPIKKTNILFDVGIGRTKNYSRNKTILNNLLKLGINKIDAVFISHNHRDHYNNLNFLKENINIQKIYTNKKPQKEYLINNLLIKNLSYSFYEKFQKENNRSLVLNFSINNKNILFPFDLEKQGEIELLNKIKNKIDILQVPHHGSNTSSTDLFIKQIEPKFCLISANKVSFVRKRLENYKCKVYNTYKRGYLILELNKKIKIKTQF